MEFCGYVEYLLERKYTITSVRMMTTTMRVGNLKKRSLVEAAIHVLWLCHGKFGWWKCLEVCEHRQG